MGLLKEFAKKSVVTAVSLAFLGNNIASAAMVTEYVNSGEEVVSKMFSEQLDVKNIVFSSPEKFACHFTGGTDDIGMEKGVVLSTDTCSRFISMTGTGDLAPRPTASNSPTPVHVVDNPEASSEQNSEKSENKKTEMSGSIKNFKADPDGSDVNDDNPGDNDVSSLIGGVRTVDASVLEFDINPEVKKIVSFKCVFAAEDVGFGEEIPGQDSPVLTDTPNDAFGIWVNGENKALLPKSGLPVTVKNIVENEDYIYSENENAQLRLPLKTKLMEFKTEIEPNKDNHIKLAIADAEHSEGASAVFLNAQMTDAPVIPPEEVPETSEKTEELPETSEKPEEVPENPKTSDISLPIIAMSTLASVSGLVVLVNKHRKINEKA